MATSTQQPAGGPDRDAEDGPSRGAEDRCPECGEMVRRGLVRCFNCGGFMRGDIAARYTKMRQETPEIAFQPLPELRSDGTFATPEHDHPAPPAGAVAAEDDDFELAGGFGEERPTARAHAPSPTDEIELLPEDPGPAAADGGTPGADDSDDSEGGEDSGDTYSLSGADADETDADDGNPAGRDEPPAPAKSRRSPAEPEEDHSVATAGEALLQLAMTDPGVGARGASGLRKTKAGWLVRCPAGHAVQVKARHAGKVGRCPTPGCGLKFFVPESIAAADDEGGADAEQTSGAGKPAAPDPLAAGPYTVWIADVRLHEADPAKVKHKPGALEKAFKPADLAVSEDAVLVVGLVGQKGGPFGLSRGKPEEVRDAVRAKLAERARTADLPGEHLLFSDANVGEVRLEQPAPYAHESLFGGEPVFGAGRIALRLPALDGDSGGTRPFLSMTLSQFRRFARTLADRGWNENLGGGVVPLEDEKETVTGHFSEREFLVLKDPALAEADPEIDTEIAGYRCGSCGIVVSEASRKKEKVGGPAGKSLEKAKCPKCGDPFGRIPLIRLKADAPEEALG